ncbi:MAG: adenylate/guanylate cyclase domain-containing protein [Gallionella sp.]|jgi:class 3 adenylate cyclase
MSGNKGKLAVLFADIFGTSDLHERLGDERAQQSIVQCVDLMTKVLSNYEGTLVKIIGDEVMCTFPTAELAFHAACAMQSAVESGMYQDGTPMHIRIGFHYGEASHESGDVFGDTVDVAARVAAKTRASQIIVTQAVIEALPPALRNKTRQLLRVELKGKLAQFDIYLVIWTSDEKLRVRIGTPDQRKS